MPRVPQVGEHVQVSILGRNDWSGRLNLDLDERVVVLPLARERSPEPTDSCRYPDLCPSCSEDIRAEALQWLRGLADDYFGLQTGGLARLRRVGDDTDQDPEARPPLVLINKHQLPPRDP
jgi:hypothetical protein